MPIMYNLSIKESIDYFQLGIAKLYPEQVRDNRWRFGFFDLDENFGDEGVENPVYAQIRGFGMNAPSLIIYNRDILPKSEDYICIRKEDSGLLLIRSKKRRSYQLRSSRRSLEGLSDKEIESLLPDPIKSF
jgi:hypothetical protein